MSFPRYPEYKDSGVEWLGEVPAHWEVARLRTVASLNPTKTEVRPLSPETAVTFLPMEAIGENGLLDLTRERPLGEVNEGYTYLRDGDVAFAKITPCFENGKGAVMRGLRNGIGFGTTELVVARPNLKRLRPEFLHHLFSTAQFRDLGAACMYGAGGQKRVPDDFVYEFIAPLPPISEQDTITEFLKTETAKIDALVAEQKRLIALLQEKRQAVISHAVTKGLNPDAPMKDSGVDWLGEVPAHWVLTPLRYLCVSVEQGWSPQCESRPADIDTEWGVLKVGAVNSGFLDPSEQKKLPDDIDPDASLSLRKGDVLVSRANTRELVGRAAVVDQDYPRLLLCDKLYRLRVDETCISPLVVGLVLGIPAFRARIELDASGASSSMLNISQGAILGLPMPTPPLSEQMELIEYCRAEAKRFNQLIQEARRAMKLLSARRSSLIGTVVTGRINVRSFKGVEAA